MKAKKGSARTRKFASGGDIAAGLVGLGTLGYLLSKKKDKEKEDKGTMSSIGEKSDVAERILSRSASSAAQESAEDRQKKANMGEPEESDIQKAVGKPPASTTPAETAKTSAPTETARPVKIMKPTPAKPAATKPAAKPAATKPAVPDLKPGESKVVGEGKLKPYPKDAKPAAKPTEGKPAAKPAEKTKSSGMGPKNTFLTKERLDKSKEAMRRAREGMKAGGAVKSSASKRADGIAQRGKTRGRVL